MLDYFLTVGNERIDNFGALTWSDDIEYNINFDGVNSRRKTIILRTKNSNNRKSVTAYLANNRNAPN